MLRALVLKDLLLLNYRLYWILPLPLVTLLVMARGAAHELFGMNMGFLAAGMFVMYAGVIEERSRADVLLHLLPIGRRRIVQGRYVSMGVLAGATSALCLLLVVPIMFVAPAPPAPSTLVLLWLWGVSTSCVFWAVLFPLTFAQDMTRSQAPISIGLVVWVLLASEPVVRWLRPVLTLPWAIGMLGAALSLAYLSYRLSVWIYERRDL